jgi:hypothetical protein
MAKHQSSATAAWMMASRNRVNSDPIQLASNAITLRLFSNTSDANHCIEVPFAD